MEQERELALLRQEMGGGGYTIGSLLFTTLEESNTYCNLHFPPKSYDCIVGLMGLMGSVTDSVSVVCQSKADDRMLIGARTNLTPKQSRIIASFSVTYPVILASPKAGHSQGYDSGAMKAFKDLDFGDCQKVLAFTLTGRMQTEVLALKGHFDAQLCLHPQAKDLCPKILQAAMDFWNAYVPPLALFYTKLLSKVCKGGKCSKDLQ